MTEPTSRSRKYYVLAVLTALLVLGMIDRLALSLLVEPVKHDLGIGDGQMSLLLGASFALFYSLIGLPAGYLVDRLNRRNLMLGGALVWTLMTFASAYAPTFGWLFVCRAGVGIGEAFLSPAIYSIIRDSFAPRERAFAYGINNMGSPLGTGLALILIGHASGAAAAGYFDAWSLVGHLGSWRTVLALVGLGGIPVALLMLTISEPARPDDSSLASDASVSAVWGHFLSQRLTYGALFLSTAFYGAGLNGMLSWLPSAINRAWGLPVAKIGPQLGGIQIIASPLGLVLAGLVLSWMARRGWWRAVPLMGGGALIVGATMIELWARTSNLSESWTFLAVLLFLTPWSGVTIATLLAQLTPSRMLGKISSVNFLMLGLVGMIVGPSLNPWLASLLSGKFAMVHAIGIGSGAAMLLSGLMLLLVGLVAPVMEDRSQ
jgi:predicted MFS family arabinose efflux permease